MNVAPLSLKVRLLDDVAPVTLVGFSFVSITDWLVVLLVMAGLPASKSMLFMAVAVEAGMSLPAAGTRGLGAVIVKSGVGLVLRVAVLREGLIRMADEASLEAVVVSLTVLLLLLDSEMVPPFLTLDSVVVMTGLAPVLPALMTNVPLSIGLPVAAGVTFLAMVLPTLVPTTAETTGDANASEPASMSTERRERRLP